VIPLVVHVASGREWRGGQRQVFLLATELERLGIDQIVVTTTGSELARRLSVSRVRVRPARWVAGLDPRVVPAILAELRRPALLHAHDAHALTLAGVSSVLARTPLIVTRRVDFHLTRRGFWRRADRVIAISHAVAEVLVADGIARDRITVVHSGISVEATRRATRLGIRAHLGLPPGSRIASNVAALVEHKDHATLILAAKLLELRCPNLHWVIAGEGRLRPALEKRVQEVGLTHRVHLLGHIPEPERLIVDSDLFVMSSQEEGLGTSVLEAMALGIPVASTRAGGLPELLGDGAGLLVEPRNPDALASAAARILEDSELRNRLVSRASAQVLRFTDRQMAAEVASVYRSCAHTLEGS
jgi:glycosyltransferase involved in cell wall biosynthesis